MKCCIIPPPSSEALRAMALPAPTGPAPSLESIQHRCERPTARPPRRKTAALAAVALLALSACAIEVDAHPGEPSATHPLRASKPNAPMPAPLPGTSAHAISATTAEWVNVYGEPERCDLSALRVIEADASEFKDHCGATVNQLHACYTGGKIVIKAAHPRHEKIHSIVHEALHWLSECSGAFPDLQPHHDAPEVWALDVSGVLGRVLDQLFGDRMLGLYPAELYAAEQATGLAGCDYRGPRVIETGDAALVRELCGEDIEAIRGCHTADAIVIVKRYRKAEINQRTRLEQTSAWLTACSGPGADRALTEFELHEAGR